MSRYTLSVLLALTALSSRVGVVRAQPDPSVTTPLADKRFHYPDQIVSTYSCSFDLSLHFIYLTFYSECSHTKQTQTMVYAVLNKVTICVTLQRRVNHLCVKRPW